MEATGEEALMAIEQNTGRRWVLADIQSGVFLKQVIFLNDTGSSFLCVGLFECLGNVIGFYFKSKSSKNGVLFTFDSFNQFCPHFGSVSVALSGGKLHAVHLDSGKEDIKVKSVFGRQMVFLYNGSHTATLNAGEWLQFVRNLPVVNTYVAELYPHEQDLGRFIFDFMTTSDEEKVGPDSPKSVHPSLINRLVAELIFLRRYKDIKNESSRGVPGVLR